MFCTLYADVALRAQVDKMAVESYNEVLSLDHAVSHWYVCANHTRVVPLRVASLLVARCVVHAARWAQSRMRTHVWGGCDECVRL
jgi:hypothetical protein